MWTSVFGKSKVALHAQHVLSTFLKTRSDSLISTRTRCSCADYRNKCKMLVTPSKSVPLHRIPLNSVTPVKDLLQFADDRRDPFIYPNPVGFSKRTRKHKEATTSTVLQGESSNAGILFEMSSIAADQSSQLLHTWETKKTVFHGQQQKSVDSPAKIFARMKAKLINPCKVETPGRAEEQDVYHTPGKCMNQDLQQTCEMEALTLSPVPACRREHCFRRDSSQSEDTLQRGHLGTFKASRTELKTSGVSTLLKCPNSTCPTAHTIQHNKEWKQPISTNRNDHEMPDLSPEVPKNNMPFYSKMRANHTHNSPAKIFVQMKEKVHLMQLHEKTNHISNTVDARNGNYSIGFHKQSAMVSEDEHSLNTNFTADVPSIVTTTSNGLLDDCTSSFPDGSANRPNEPVPKVAVHQQLWELIEDPLLQKTPRISIPKKKATLFQHVSELNSSNKEPVVTESAIHLREWHIKIMNNGIFVDGVRVDDDVPWHSNIIAERIACNILKTVSGSTYVLVGNMVKDNSSTLPKWLLKKFLFGFPQKWENYLETYLSQLKSLDSDPKKIQNSIASKVHQRQSKSVKKGHSPLRVITKAHKSPAASPPRGQDSVTKVSRSGRLIKPPLEYWKGGRIVLDADMNVTIHEDYASSSNLHLMGKWSVRLSNVFITDGLVSHSSSSDEKKASGLQRKVKPYTQLRHKRQPQQEILQRPSLQRNQSTKNLKSRTGIQKFHDVELDSATDSSTRASRRNRISVIENRGKNQVLFDSYVEASELDTGMEHSTPQSESPPLQENHVIDAGAKRTGYRRGTVNSCAEEPPSVTKTSLRCIQRGTNKSKPLQALLGKGSKRISEDSETDSTYSNTVTRQSSRLRSKNRMTQGNLTKSDTLQDHHKSNSLADGCGSGPAPSKVFTLPNNQHGLMNSRSKEHEPAQVSNSDGMHQDYSLQTASVDGGRKGKHAMSKSSPLAVNSTVEKPNLGRLSKGPFKRSLPRVGKGFMVDSSDLNTDDTDFSSSPEDFTRSKEGKHICVKSSTILQKSTKLCEKKQEVSRGGKGKNHNARLPTQTEVEGDDADTWTEKELDKLQKAVTTLPKHKSGFWENVAMMVGTHSAKECQEQHMQQQVVKAHSKSKKSMRVPSQEEPGKEAPEITAKVGTLKRKQQIRQFLDHMPKDNHDDIFTSSPLQNKRVKLPTLSAKVEDHVFQHLEPSQTPSSTGFPQVKTPQCLHISPGMLGSINRTNSDRYVYQLQKKMRKGWAKVHGPASSSQECRFTPASSRTSARRRNEAENGSLVVWEMFSGKDPAPFPSDESGEEDYYFADD
ncbi:mis18-binding protein 1 [Arapaima gigas]